MKSREDQPVTTTISRTALDNVYEEIKRHVQNNITKSYRFCAITLDMWEDKYRRRPYRTFTLHYISDSFDLTHLTLSTRILKHPHTGEAISEAILDIKEEFQLNDKEIFAVSDAGRNVKKEFA